MEALGFDMFRKRFTALVQHNRIDWTSVGFLTADNHVLSFGTDSKVISTVFEAFVGPLIHQIAADFDYVVEGARQTVYPDFTLSPKLTGRPRIAIDVKTTYRALNQNGTCKRFRYTLGSYTSFLRTSGAKKNILHPYAEYSDHWVIGFLYTRKEGVPAKVYRRVDANTGLCPYEDIEFFVQEKYKVVGESPGSGNTTNIGSFPTNDISDMREGRGPFASHGKDICDDYWRHYEQKASDRCYGTVEEFLAWREKR